VRLVTPLKQEKEICNYQRRFTPVVEQQREWTSGWGGKKGGKFVKRKNLTTMKGKDSNFSENWATRKDSSQDEEGGSRSGGNLGKKKIKDVWRGKKVLQPDMNVRANNSEKGKGRTQQQKRIAMS